MELGAESIMRVLSFVGDMTSGLLSILPAYSGQLDNLRC